MSTPEMEKYSLPEATPFENHGRTTAGWTWAIGVCIGVLVTGIGLIVNPIVLWTGIGIIVLATVAGLVLHAMGHGQPTSLTQTAKGGAWYKD